MAEQPPAAEPTPTEAVVELDSQRRRFLDLVACGYSEETSALLADAPVSLDSIIDLFEPDA